MSIAALNWAWSKDAPTSTAKLVLVALADHANAEGECWPSMGSVALLAQCSPRQVARCIDALEDAGLLTRKRRRMGGGKLGSYTYRLAVTSGHTRPLDAGDQSSPTSGHPRPVDTDDQRTPEAPTTGHPRPSPPDTSVCTEPPVEPPVNPHSSDVPSDPEFPEVVRHLTRTLALAVKANGFKVPAKGRKAHREWLVAMDRLLRIDGADPDVVEQVIGWSTEDGFWRSNIRSAPKFRDQYPALRLKMAEAIEAATPQVRAPRQDPVAAKYGPGAR